MPFIGSDGVGTAGEAGDEFGADVAIEDGLPGFGEFEISTGDEGGEESGVGLGIGL